jgi:hypothetical protein
MTSPLALAALALLLAAAPSPVTAAELTHVGGEIREAAFAYQVELGWPLSKVVIEQELVNRGAADGAAIYAFELPRAAAIVELIVTDAAGHASRAAALDEGAARTQLDGPPDGARPDLALLRMTDDAPAAAPRATTRYELRLYPVPAGKSVRTAMRILVPTAYQDDRLLVRLPARGERATLAREQASLSFRSGAGLRGLDDARVGGRPVRAGEGRAGAAIGLERGALTVEAKPRWGVPTSALVQTASAALDGGAGLVALAIAAPAAVTRPSAPAAPDRVIVLLDRSRSLGEAGRAASERAVAAVLAAAPRARVEVVTYARTAAGVLGALAPNGEATRAAIVRALAGRPLAAGGDLGAALELAADRLASSSGDAAIVVIGDGILPDELDEREAIARLGRATLEHARVVSIVLVPDGAPLPALAGGALDGLAAASGGALHLVRHGDRAGLDRAAALVDRSLDLALIDDGTSRGLALPSTLAPGEGGLALGWYDGKAPDLELTLGGVAARPPVARPTLAAPATQLVLAHAQPSELLGPTPPTDASDEALRERLVAAATRAGVVSPQTALVAHASGDGFGKDRLALARRWGGRAYRRIGWPGEPTLPPPTLAGGRSSGAQTIGAAGALDRVLVDDLLNRQLLPRARRCYAAGRQRVRGMEGRVFLTLELARGEVLTARVDGQIGEPTLRGCLVDAGYALTVPAARPGPGEERIEVSYVFELRPGTSGPSAAGAIFKATRDSLDAAP